MNEDYTKPRYGSGIGELLKSYVASRNQEGQLKNQNQQVANQGRQLQNQEKELGWKDPNRSLGLRDFLEMGTEIYKQNALTNAMYGSVPGYQPQQVDLKDFSQFMQNLQSVFNTQQGAGQSMLPQQPASGLNQSLQNKGGTPQNSSVLQKYGIQPSAQPQAPSVTPVNVNRAGSSNYRPWRNN